MISFKLIIHKSSNNLLSIRALYKPNQSLFLIMSHSTNTLYVPTNSTTTLALVSSTSYDVSQTAFENTIKSLFAKLNDKLTKQDKILESIITLIVNQDAKINNKFKEELQTMSLQIAYISSK